MSVRRRTLLALAMLASYAVVALPVCLVQPPELATAAHPMPHAPAPEVATDPHAAHHGHHDHHAMQEPAPETVPAAAPVCLCGCKGWLRAAPSAGISFVSLPSEGASPELPLLFARPSDDATPRAPSAPLDPPEHVPIA